MSSTKNDNAAVGGGRGVAAAKGRGSGGGGVTTKKRLQRFDAILGDLDSMVRQHSGGGGIMTRQGISEQPAGEDGDEDEREDGGVTSGNHHHLNLAFSSSSPTRKFETMRGWVDKGGSDNDDDDDDAFGPIVSKNGTSPSRLSTKTPVVTTFHDSEGQRQLSLAAKRRLLLQSNSSSSSSNRVSSGGGPSSAPPPGQGGGDYPNPQSVMVATKSPATTGASCCSSSSPTQSDSSQSFFLSELALKQRETEGDVDNIIFHAKLLGNNLLSVFSEASAPSSTDDKEEDEEPQLTLLLTETVRSFLDLLSDLTAGRADYSGTSPLVSSPIGSFFGSSLGSHLVMVANDGGGGEDDTLRYSQFMSHLNAMRKLGKLQKFIVHLVEPLQQQQQEHAARKNNNPPRSRTASGRRMPPTTSKQRMTLALVEMVLKYSYAMILQVVLEKVPQELLASQGFLHVALVRMASTAATEHHDDNGYCGRTMGQEPEAGGALGTEEENREELIDEDDPVKLMVRRAPSATGGQQKAAAAEVPGKKEEVKKNKKKLHWSMVARSGGGGKKKEHQERLGQRQGGGASAAAVDEREEEEEPFGLPLLLSEADQKKPQQREKGVAYSSSLWSHTADPQSSSTSSLEENVIALLKVVHTLHCCHRQEEDMDGNGSSNLQRALTQHDALVTSVIQLLSSNSSNQIERRGTTTTVQHSNNNNNNTGGSSHHHLYMARMMRQEDDLRVGVSYCSLATLLHILLSQNSQQVLAARGDNTGASGEAVVLNSNGGEKGGGGDTSLLKRTNSNSNQLAANNNNHNQGITTSSLSGGGSNAIPTSRVLGGGGAGEKGGGGSSSTTATTTSGGILFFRAKGLDICLDLLNTLLRPAGRSHHRDGCVSVHNNEEDGDGTAVTSCCCSSATADRFCVPFLVLQLLQVATCSPELLREQEQFPAWRSRICSAAAGGKSKYTVPAASPNEVCKKLLLVLARAVALHEGDGLIVDAALHIMINITSLFPDAAATHHAARNDERTEEEEEGAEHDMLRFAEMICQLMCSSFAMSDKGEEDNLTGSSSSASDRAICCIALLVNMLKDGRNPECRNSLLKLKVVDKKEASQEEEQSSGQLLFVQQLARWMLHYYDGREDAESNVKAGYCAMLLGIISLGCPEARIAVMSGLVKAREAAKRAAIDGTTTTSSSSSAVALQKKKEAEVTAAATVAPKGKGRGRKRGRDEKVGDKLQQKQQQHESDDGEREKERKLQKMPMLLVVALLQEFILFQSEAGILTKEMLLSMHAVIDQLVHENKLQIEKKQQQEKANGI